MNNKNMSLVYHRETTLYVVSLITSILIVIFLLFSIFGAFILLFLLLTTVFSHVISMSYVQLNGVRLNKSQFGDIYGRVITLSEKLGLERVPEVYILESGGILNAFATRVFALFGRNIVILYSDVAELAETEGNDELDFVIAHELAHIQRNHITKRMLVFPAMWVPFLSEAYSRACEYSADRIAVFHTGNVDKAVQALTLFAAGKRLFTHVNIEEYLRQYNEKKGFFISLSEMLSTHPPLPRRIFEITMFMQQETGVRYEQRSRLSVIIVFLVVPVIFMIFAGIITAAGVFLVSIAEEEINMNNLDYYSEDEEYIPYSVPIVEAAYMYDYDEVERLINDDVDINEQEDSNGETALSMAVYNGDIKMIHLLLDAGADPNISDYSGYTPLHVAVTTGNPDIVQPLLEAGADPTIVNDYGADAYSEAKTYGYQTIIDLLNSYK